MFLKSICPLTLSADVKIGLIEQFCLPIIQSGWKSLEHFDEFVEMSTHFCLSIDPNHIGNSSSIKTNI